MTEPSENTDNHQYHFHLKPPEVMSDFSLVFSAFLPVADHSHGVLPVQAKNMYIVRFLIAHHVSLESSAHECGNNIHKNFYYRILEPHQSDRSYRHFPGYEYSKS